MQNRVWTLIDLADEDGPMKPSILSADKPLNQHIICLQNVDTRKDLGVIHCNLDSMFPTRAVERENKAHRYMSGD